VGAVAVQLAKAFGADVTGVDSASKLEMLRSVGADQVIDYTEEGFTRRRERYDLIIDIPGNDPLAECRRVLTSYIDKTYPLSEIPDAIRHLQEGRAKGKVVITL
jgi:NADPH:quinone reductase-like Zn-dependent oxidoreductase